jgi:adenylylsulfate kinase
MTSDDSRRNLTWHTGDVTRADRERMNGHRGATLWLTGLSGSGKSTVAHRVEAHLAAAGMRAYVLDGDNVRHGLNRDLGFGEADRHENIRRVAEVARLFTDAGLIAIVAFISPYRADRAAARALVGDDFVEVYVATPAAVCEARDPKGLWARARRGELRAFTGVDAPYEPPEHTDVTIGAAGEDVEACARAVVAHLVARGVVPAGV